MKWIWLRQDEVENPKAEVAEEEKPVFFGWVHLCPNIYGQCGNLMGGLGHDLNSPVHIFAWVSSSLAITIISGSLVSTVREQFFFLIMWLMCQSSHCDKVFQLQIFLSHGTVQSGDLPANHRRDGTTIIAGSYSSLGFEKIH